MSLKQVEQFVSESFLKSLDDALAELLEVRPSNDHILVSVVYIFAAFFFLLIFLNREIVYKVH